MDLKAEVRKDLGKKVRNLREKNLIPAELYGQGIKNAHLMVGGKDFKKAFKTAGESSLLNLLVDAEKRPVLIQDVAYDPLSGEPIHIDFYQVKMDEKVKVRVPLEFLGEAPAVKEKAGLLNRTMLDIEVEALPANLPHNIQVFLKNLADIGSSIYVKDLKVASGVKILIDPMTVVATVIMPSVEEEIVKAPSVEEVKVETEEKKAERQKEAQTKEGVKTAAPPKEEPKK